jgi:hypothetical protein
MVLIRAYTLVINLETKKAAHPNKDRQLLFKKQHLTSWLQLLIKKASVNYGVFYKLYLINLH